jgi:LacI family transcriptional regulator
MQQALLSFRKAGGGVTVIGRHSIGADAVLPDNIGGGRSIAGHLLAKGHRKIAIASGWQGLTTVVDRLTGIDQALQDVGLTLAELPIVETVFTREGGRHAAQTILAENPDITAILALSDDMAIGVLSTLRSRGIPVPAQVSVVGFDDVSIAQDVSPGLTTIQLPLAQMGADAVRLVLKQRSDPTRPRRKTAEHRLVVRDSTGPVRLEPDIPDA